MSPQLIRVIFSVLAVRAIFISPALGSEFGHSNRPSQSSLLRGEVVSRCRLRFTAPDVPSASSERFDCIDGGDGNDGERNRPDRDACDRWTRIGSSWSRIPAGKPAGVIARGFVRLRC